MVTLHQFLETHFYLCRGRADIEPERIEGFALGVADRSGFRTCALFGLQPFAEQTEWVGVGAECPHVRPHGTFAGSHLPSWTMAGKCILLVSHHRGVAHAGEEIV